MEIDAITTQWKKDKHCFNCRQIRHFVNKCTKPKKANCKWYLKAKVKEVIEDEDNNSEAEGDSSDHLEKEEATVNKEPSF